MSRQQCTIAGTTIYAAHITTSSYGVNRILHVYPGGLQPMVETLGQKPTIFEIEGYLNVNDGGLLGRAFSAITGSDAYQDLTDLMSLMNDNSGDFVELVHPTMGNWFGTILDCPYSEDARRQGIVEIRMIFYAQGKMATSRQSLFSQITNVVTGNPGTGIGTIGSAFNTAMQAKSLLSNPTAALATIGTSVTGLLTTSTGLLGSVSGIDSLFGGAATLGRYAQTATVSAEVLSGINTRQTPKEITSDVTSAVIAKTTDARRTVMSSVAVLNS